MNGTVSGDLAFFSEQQLIYLAAIDEAAARVPFLSITPAQALVTKVQANYGPSTYERRLTELSDPNPQPLLKGRAVTAVEYAIHCSVLLSQRAQLAMRLGMAGGGANALYQRFGGAFVHYIVQILWDEIANNAFTDTWQEEGVPFISDSHPMAGGATRSNYIPSTLDATAYKSALVLSRKRKDYDGVVAAGEPGFLCGATDLDPVVKELVNANQKVPVGTQALDATGHGYAGPSYFAGESVTGLTSPFITDPTAWLLLDKAFRYNVLLLEAPMPREELKQGTADRLFSDNPLVHCYTPNCMDAVGGGAT